VRSPVAVLGLLALALSAFSVASCNGILGIDPPNLIEGDAGGASDGSDGSAATPIASLRNPASPNRAVQDARVSIAGAVVTNVKSVGTSKIFFVQDPSVKSWGGIVIFTGADVPTVVPGAVVSATGRYTSFRGLEEIDISVPGGSYTQTGTAPLPEPIDVQLTDINTTMGGRTLELQSMLLRIKNVVAISTTVSQEFGVTFDADAGTMNLYITSFYANDVGAPPFTANTGDRFKSITGNGIMGGRSTETPIGKLAPGAKEDLVRQ
jgi:hypothetical protein